MYILSLAQIILAVCIILLVMLQAKGNGLSIIPTSGDFGKFERRGPEQILHTITIALVVSYIGVVIAIYMLAA